jgi:hypothetical protein
MHLVYLDDSRDERLCVCTALVIPAEEWRTAFGQIRDWRRQLKRTDGIFVYKELHGWKLVSGRGRISDRVVPKGRRCAIFREGLDVVTKLPQATLFNTVFPKDEDITAYERLLNRINRTMQACDSFALLIWDEGKEAEHRRLTRRMRVHNPIPSMYGEWAPGTYAKNIPLERVIEDPVFKQSEQSYFVQLVDFCAYALLRREHPIPSRSRYGLDKAFGILSPILFTKASRRDPEGILRP